MGRLAYSVALLFLIGSNACFAVLPREIYCSVMEDPELVRAADGFLPKGMDGARQNEPIPSVSLYNHAMGSETGLARYDSGYVSTTSSLRLAHIWSNSQFPGTSYIYTIQPTPNFIDVNASLGRYSPLPGEKEFAALGQIRWAQIIKWRRVHFNAMGSLLEIGTLIEIYTRACMLLKVCLSWPVFLVLIQLGASHHGDIIQILMIVILKSVLALY